MVQLLTADGEFSVSKEHQVFEDIIRGLKQEDFLKFYRDMARLRRFDGEATALQRQGQLGLWVPTMEIGRAHV